MPKMPQSNMINPDWPVIDTLLQLLRHWGTMDAGAGKQMSVRLRPEAAGAPAGTPE